MLEFVAEMAVVWPSISTSKLLQHPLIHVTFQISQTATPITSIALPILKTSTRSCSSICKWHNPCKMQPLTLIASTRILSKYLLDTSMLRFGMVRGSGYLRNAEAVGMFEREN
jgi:hypothetical protein